MASKAEPNVKKDQALKGKLLKSMKVCVQQMFCSCWKNPQTEEHIESPSETDEVSDTKNTNPADNSPRFKDMDGLLKEESYTLGPGVLSMYDIHTLKTFPPQPFTDNSYAGLCREVKKWTMPLRSLPQLHSVFLEFAKENYDDLDELSKKLQDMVIALNDKKPISHDKEIASIVQSLSRDDTKKDQLKSMIIVSDAFVKFSGHIVQRSAEIEKLTKEKRKSLMNIMIQIPYGTKEHQFSDMEATATFMDSSLQPIMRAIGFDKKKFGSELTWTAKEDCDQLVAGFFLLWGTFLS